MRENSKWHNLWYHPPAPLMGPQTPGNWIARPLERLPTGGVMPKQTEFSGFFLRESTCSSTEFWNDSHGKTPVSLDSLDLGPSVLRIDAVTPHMVWQDIPNQLFSTDFIPILPCRTLGVTHWGLQRPFQLVYNISKNYFEYIKNPINNLYVLQYMYYSICIHYIFMTYVTYY